MKRNKEIIDLPVISIADGVQIGNVKGLVVNPQQKIVEFLLLAENNKDSELKGIPFRLAEAIGEFAVTVENKSVLINMEKISILQELVQKRIDAIGTKVITKKGKYLGDVTEYSFDTATGALKEFYYLNEEQVEEFITATNVITIGKEVLVVEEDAISGVLHRDEHIAGQEEKTEDFIPGEGEPSLKEKGMGEQSSLPEITGNLKDLLPPEEKNSLDPTGTFVQRQRRYIVGKTLLKDLKTDDGEVIAPEDTVITEGLFDHISKMGAQKLMELAVSVKE